MRANEKGRAGGSVRRAVGSDLSRPHVAPRDPLALLPARRAGRALPNASTASELDQAIVERAFPKDPAGDTRCGHCGKHRKATLTLCWLCWRKLSAFAQIEILRAGGEIEKAKLILLTRPQPSDPANMAVETQDRACGICGVRDIPFGMDWPYWTDGRPVHPECLA